MSNKNIKLKDGSDYLLPQTKLQDITDLSAADLIVKSLTGGLEYEITEPTSANSGGFRVCVLDHEPTTKYSGWLYIITTDKAQTFIIIPSLTNCTADEFNHSTTDNKQTETLTFYSDTGYLLPSNITVEGANKVSWTVTDIYPYQYIKSGSNLKIFQAPYTQSGSEVII